MQKQCKYCGDYFKTSIKTRSFCQYLCAVRYFNVSTTDYRLMAKCHLCGDKVNLEGMRQVYWDSELHEVCLACSVDLREQGGDSLYMEAMPTLLE